MKNKDFNKFVCPVCNKERIFFKKKMFNIKEVWKCSKCGRAFELNSEIKQEIKEKKYF